MTELEKAQWAIQRLKVESKNLKVILIKAEAERDRYWEAIQDVKRSINGFVTGYTGFSHLVYALEKLNEALAPEPKAENLINAKGETPAQWAERVADRSDPEGFDPGELTSQANVDKKLKHPPFVSEEEVLDAEAKADAQAAKAMEKESPTAMIGRVLDETEATVALSNFDDEEELDSRVILHPMPKEKGGDA